ncbi:tRNA(His) guanylyltransferase Thg1 family protein [Bifidobacterium callitrichidarum]|uniref:tRNA(His) guanylyltransferase Thg1 family protein n=1 Tax=Bifidobacterium callitrichidarum TaxID=2052941 RepID=UPI001304DD4B|nr:tRNA(His) guanylyltransferase Thg1 family protein [Bifidobacterium callitrichidarum]
MTVKDPLGDHFKAFEAIEERTIDSSYAAIRVDGRAFHTLTKSMEKPFDFRFVQAMNAAARAAANAYHNVAFAYVQSDEISFILYRGSTGYPFNGRTQKLITLAASAASAAFAVSLERVDLESPPIFDGRIISLDSAIEVENYLSWRRLDCMKNAVSSCCNALFTQEELHGRTTRERQEMLQGTVFEHIDDGLFYGRFVCREVFEKTGPGGEIAQRHRWIVIPGDRKHAGSLIAGLPSV